MALHHGTSHEPPLTAKAMEKESLRGKGERRKKKAAINPGHYTASGVKPDILGGEKKKITSTQRKKKLSRGNIHLPSKVSTLLTQ